MARASIEKLRDLVTDLQLIDSVRGLISLFSARQPPEEGKLPAPLFPDELPTGAAYDALVKRVLTQRDHPRQASVGGRHARAGRAGARSQRSSAARASTPWSAKSARRWQDDLARHGADGAAFRRAGHAARNPQRRRARPHALQRHRLRRRLPDRDPVLPPRVVHDHRRGAAADRDPAVARRARLAQFPPQHVPQRDDAAHHGDQLLRQHAAHLRGARPADRRQGQVHRRSARPCWWSDRPAC